MFGAIGLFYTLTVLLCLTLERSVEHLINAGMRQLGECLIAQENKQLGNQPIEHDPNYLCDWFPIGLGNYLHKVVYVSVLGHLKNEIAAELSGVSQDVGELGLHNMVQLFPVVEL